MRSEFLTVEGIGSTRATAVADAWRQAQEYFGGMAGTIHSEALGSSVEARTNGGEVLTWCVNARFHVADGTSQQVTPPLRPAPEGCV